MTRRKVGQTVEARARSAAVGRRRKISSRSSSCNSAAADAIGAQDWNCKIGILVLHKNTLYRVGKRIP
jgi:hypothetical protein